MLNRAVNLMEFNELFALEQMTEGSGGFKVKDLYPFCANSKGILVGHPVNVGFNILDFVDSDGKNVGEEFLRVAKNKKINKVKYKLPRITTEDTKEFEKTPANYYGGLMNMLKRVWTICSNSYSNVEGILKCS